MFSEFPWNPESNANVSEACKPNLSGSRPKETLPRLEGTRDDVRGHLWWSQLEEGRVLASSGRRSNILPYILRHTGQLHIQELPGPKRQQHWGRETPLPGPAAHFPLQLYLMLPSYHQPNPSHLLLPGSSKLPVNSPPPHSLSANSGLRLKCFPWYLHGWASLVPHCKESACNTGNPGSIPGQKIPWRRKWQPTPVSLSGKAHGRRSLAGYSPRGRKESDTIERLCHVDFSLNVIS